MSGVQPGTRHAGPVDPHPRAVRPSGRTRHVWYDPAIPEPTSVSTD